MNNWDTDDRDSTQEALGFTNSDLTLANLPFRLLAIGNRIDLFKAKSMNAVEDAGEGRFVFTLTNANRTSDIKDFTLIFEYGQPAGDFATLAKWAKDWHELEVSEGNFTIEWHFHFTKEYLLKLNELTDRFTKRGADPSKPNGNAINQVRTNDFLMGQDTLADA